MAASSAGFGHQRNLQKHSSGVSVFTSKATGLRVDRQEIVATEEEDGVILANW